MGDITIPAPVKLFVGVLTSFPDILPAVEERLSALYGDIDIKSDPYLFDWTCYYDASMGKPIYRVFLGFEDLIDPVSIAKIKTATNRLESSFAEERTQVARPVNLDPGYVEQSKLVLASTKNFYHRILVSGGIYAEVTLHYERKAWRAFPWTFPDFASDRYHPFLERLRNLYRRQLPDVF